MNDLLQIVSFLLAIFGIAFKVYNKFFSEKIVTNNEDWQLNSQDVTNAGNRLFYKNIFDMNLNFLYKSFTLNNYLKFDVEILLHKMHFSSGRINNITKKENGIYLEIAYTDKIFNNKNTSDTKLQNNIYLYINYLPPNNNLLIYSFKTEGERAVFFHQLATEIEQYLKKCIS